MTTQVVKTRPVLFWAVLVSSLAMSILFTWLMPHEPVSVLLTALSWLGTVALVWTRWFKASALWLVRVATAIGAAIMFVIGYQWTSQDDVFVIAEHCGCKQHAGTFWPLLFMWLAGNALLAYTLAGSFSRSLIRPLSLKSALWWPSAAIWLAVCVQVFARNITVEVLIASLRTAGLTIGAIVAFFGGIVALIYVLGYPERRRTKRMRAEFEKIDEGTQHDIIELIHRRAGEHEFLLYYRPAAIPVASPAASPDATRDDHAQIGGDPLAPSDEPWPQQEDGTPAIFLLQLPLRAPSLADPWQGQFIAVYIQDWSLLIRSYSAADVARLAPMSNPMGEERVVRQGLQAVAVPYVPAAAGAEDEDENSAGINAQTIVERIPELQARLAPFTAHTKEAVEWILLGPEGYSLEDGIQVGGNPQFIQGEHEPRCTVCQQPMRFLFQFGDVSRKYLMGDGGIGYVYGCDAHPEHCQGFVDSY